MIFMLNVKIFKITIRKTRIKYINISFTTIRIEITGLYIIIKIINLILINFMVFGIILFLPFLIILCINQVVSILMVVKLIFIYFILVFLIVNLKILIVSIKYLLDKFYDKYNIIRYSIFIGFIVYLLMKNPITTLKSALSILNNSYYLPNTLFTKLIMNSALDWSSLLLIVELLIIFIFANMLNLYISNRINIYTLNTFFDSIKSKKEIILISLIRKTKFVEHTKVIIEKEIKNIFRIYKKYKILIYTPFVFSLVLCIFYILLLNKIIPDTYILKITQSQWFKDSRIVMLMFAQILVINQSYIALLITKEHLSISSESKNILNIILSSLDINKFVKIKYLIYCLSLLSLSFLVICPLLILLFYIKTNIIEIILCLFSLSIGTSFSIGTIDYFCDALFPNFHPKGMGNTTNKNFNNEFISTLLTSIYLWGFFGFNSFLISKYLILNKISYFHYMLIISGVLLAFLILIIRSFIYIFKKRGTKEWTY